MGMFDNVKYSCKCPNCAHGLTLFQTKTGKCTLAMLTPQQAGEFYVICDWCGAFVTVKGVPPRKKWKWVLFFEEDYRREEFLFKYPLLRRLKVKLARKYVVKQRIEQYLLPVGDLYTVLKNNGLSVRRFTRLLGHKGKAEKYLKPAKVEKVLKLLLPGEARRNAGRLTLDGAASRALIEKVGGMIKDPYLEARAKRGSLKRYKELLTLVPHVRSRKTTTS